LIFVLNSTTRVSYRVSTDNKINNTNMRTKSNKQEKLNELILSRVGWYA
jgi:hypothetical protein